ncbi:MAG TPA: glycosyltransferase, partial [Gemmataceae bacterium]|nr:glycosyltransferase [Gemmataceae bacterium]
YPLGLHRFRAEWERAGWGHAGDPAGEAAAKRDLLRWRLHALAAELTGDLVHYHEAALARPGLPEARAALGCALARGGRVADGLPHLRTAVSAQPFDLAAARALARALADTAQSGERERLAADRRLLARAAPQAVPTEAWFAAPSAVPTADKSAGIVWEGDVRGLHSLAIVNRELTAALANRGQVALSVWPAAPPAPNVTRLPARPELLPLLHRRLAGTTVHVRHQWPPRWDPPLEGRWVLIQPWEFGSLPKDWVGPILKSVDEVWVHSSYVRDIYLDAGVPNDRVHVIPLGVDPCRFRSDAAPLALPGDGMFRFLFVGGTVWRKGIDLLLEAFAREFLPDESVTLLIKGMGSGTFYRDTGEGLIGRYRTNGVRIQTVDQDLTEADLPGLYTACDCLVHPYRGEGFALPVAEAMACGLPVIVTAGGATDDYCNDETAYRVAARKLPVPPNRPVGFKTIGEPWVLEPDLEALRAALRNVVADPAAGRAKGRAASALIRQRWTWSNAAAAIENRVRALADGRPARRGASCSVPSGRARVSLCMIVRNEEQNLPDCLRGLSELFNEIVVVDTGSTDRTKEIAAELGGKVVDFPWCDDFAAARNASLDAAAGDWVMWLDADDRLDDADRAKLKELFTRLGTENAAYAMKCACVGGGPGKSATVVDHVRLFRNDPRLRWTYRVHEQILLAIRAIQAEVRWADVTIRHLGYADSALRRRKLDRDLRLLHLDDAAKPDDPFTLFNLGMVYHELGKTAEALPLLHRSLERSKSTDSIVRKLYALIAGCHRRLGQAGQALAACREGRSYYPQDAELLFLEGLVHREMGNPAAAEVVWLRLLDGKDSEHFGSVDAALAGSKARHNLAVLYAESQRYTEAETQWKAVLAADPGYAPAHVGLGELYQGQKRWEELERLLQPMGDAMPLEADLLRGRMLLERQQYGAAKQTLSRTVARHPNDVRPRVILSHALLKEATDWPAAEQALLGVLALEPDHREANRNLRILRERHGRPSGP